MQAFPGVTQGSELRLKYASSFRILRALCVYARMRMQAWRGGRGWDSSLQWARYLGVAKEVFQPNDHAAYTLA